MQIHVILSISESRQACGIAMIESIASSEVQVHVLWRGLPNLEFQSKSNVHSYFLKEASLSRSRNFLISSALDLKLIGDSDVICFADDDGLWPEDLAQRILRSFSEPIEWALGIYGPSVDEVDRKRFPPTNQDTQSIEEILSRSSSLGLYVRGNLIKKAGRFDENLGLGAEIGVGEDTEYAVRLFHLATKSPYDPILIQFHPYGSQNLSSRLTASIRLICYLAGKYSLPKYPVIRRILSLILRRKINLKTITKLPADFWLGHHNRFSHPW